MLVTKIKGREYRLGKVYAETMPSGRRECFLVNYDCEKVYLSTHWARYCAKKFGATPVANALIAAND